MKPIDIAIVVCVSVLVLGVFVYLVYRKVKHKDSGCCGSCSECSMCKYAAENKKSTASEPPAEQAKSCHCCSSSAERSDE